MKMQLNITVAFEGTQMQSKDFLMYLEFLDHLKYLSGYTKSVNLY